MKTFLRAVVGMGLAIGGVAATPAMAQHREYHGQAYDGSRDGYDEDGRGGPGGYRASTGYRGGYDRGRGYDRGGDYERGGEYYRGGDYYRGGYRRPHYRPRYYRGDRCSGTGGAIVGGVIGALVGGEVGRGGYYNRRSGTGTILGAGAGALLGREIDRSDCYRR